MKFILFLLLCAPLRAMPSPTGDQAAEIGRRIWQNEAGGKVKFLTHWNVGEEFASMGIGHFIWYPAGKKGPYVESFPPLLRYLAERTQVPAWLLNADGCPWKTRDEFLRDFDGPRLTELRNLLAATVSAQTQFVILRLQQSLPILLSNVPESERGVLEKSFEAVARTPLGYYALVDYVNFKGEGVALTERYGGQGWGLLQVLQEFTRRQKPGVAPLDAFVDAADAVLTRRVDNCPLEAKNKPSEQDAKRWLKHCEDDERRWLPGWRKRLQSYRQSANKN